MKLLLDTQLLLWTGVAEELTFHRSPSVEAIALIDNNQNELYFSAVSVWEVAIKFALGKPGFRMNPHGFRRALLERGYHELAITSEHAARVGNLPNHHKDPFDRLLIAQAVVEEVTLLTVDEAMARYGPPVRQV